VKRNPNFDMSRVVTTVMIFATMLVSGGGMVAQRTMNPPIVSFCDLISNADRYKGRIVSTKATSQGSIRFESEREEASVYKSVIEAMYLRDGINLIVVKDHTVPGNFANGRLTDQLQRALRELRVSSQGADTDFLRKNGEQHPLTNLPRLSVHLKRISQSEATIIFQAGRGWEEFYQKYPGSQGVLELSRPGFNREATQALVYVANQGSWKGGAGYFVLLTKENGSWKVEKRYTSWVS
jgi:hypothetical protein